MNSNPLDLILHQSYLHIVSYGLVLAIAFVALADGYLLQQLKRALRFDNARLRQQRPARIDLEGMVHPFAAGLVQPRVSQLELNTTEAGDPADATPLQIGLAGTRRHIEFSEAALFVPLRARMSLTRDLSTLMGLIATLLALVAAATDFARHGKPELLIGSVGVGCVATCVAAVGCAISLWNLSRLTRLRLQTACETEALLLAFRSQHQPESIDEVPIRHVISLNGRSREFQPEETHASV